MARKPRVSQSPLFDAATMQPREPTRVEHPTRFDKMAIGVGAGDGYIVQHCPRCFEPCIVERSPLRWTFIHRALFTATEKTTRMKATRKCVLSSEVVLRLHGEKAIRLAQGAESIARVEQHAPQMVESIEFALERSRKLSEGGRRA